MDQYTDVNGIRTRFCEAGEGEPTVLLLHGVGGYLENWKDNIGALSERHRVVALDIVGFGRSDKPAAPYDFSYFARFVRDFMDARSIDKAAVVGSSMGACVAIYLAKSYPERVSSLVVADPGGFGKEVPFLLRLMTLPFLGERAARPDRKGTVKVWELVLHDPGIMDDELVDLAHEMWNLPDAGKATVSFLRQLVDLRGSKASAIASMQEAAAAVDLPSLVIWGAQDKYFPLSHARNAAKLLNGGKPHVFDECGHVPPIEHPDKFNSLVLDFLGEAHG